MEAVELLVEVAEHDAYTVEKEQIAKNYASIEADIFTMTQRQISREQHKTGWRRTNHGAWFEKMLDNLAGKKIA